MVHNITPFVNKGFADMESKQTQTTTTEGSFGAIRETKRDESETNGSTSEPTKVDVSWGHGQIYSGKLQMASWPTPVGDKIVRCWAYSKHQIPTLFKHPHNPTYCLSLKYSDTKSTASSKTGSPSWSPNEYRLRRSSAILANCSAVQSYPQTQVAVLVKEVH